MAGMLDQLEIEIGNRLTSLPFFATLTVHADPQKNVVEEIAHKIAKIRTLIAPLVSAADDNNPNTPSPYFDNIQIDVGVFQNPLIAANDPTPRTICEQIHSAFKMWKPASLSDVLVPRKPGISYSAKDGKLNIWNCAFATRGGFIGDMTKVATPTAGVAANVTLACATAGAAIFYTTNPDVINFGPRSGTLYTAPFVTPAPGTKIRTRAFLAGYLDSDIIKTII